jgi:hypothetical protein
MITPRFTFLLQSLMAIAAAAIISCTFTLSENAWAQEQPLVPEQNPPGDIPDSQVFLDYASPLGFSVRVPEGWARTDRSDGVLFVDKYDSVAVSVAAAVAAPTAQTVRENEVPSLVKAGRAVKISAISTVKLPAGVAVRIAYTSNSEPNAVTNKKIRLENNRYLFFNAGRLAALDLSAPAGADNVDQWKLMAESFRWH